MRMRLINLDRSTDRLALFRTRNPALGAIQRISAVDGSMADRKRLIDNDVLAPDLAYSNGALGCALSHLTQWRDSIQADTVLTVIEDDAIVCANFEAEVTRVIATLPADWEFVMWGFNFDAPLHFDLGENLSSCISFFDQAALRTVAANFATSDIATVPFRLLSAFGTVCYSISPRGAKRLLDFCMPLRPMETYYSGLQRSIPNSGIDNLLAHIWPECLAYVAMPPLAISENDHSSSTVQTGIAGTPRAEDTFPTHVLTGLFERIGVTDRIVVGIREHCETPLSIATLRQADWRGFDVTAQAYNAHCVLRDRDVPKQFDLLYVRAAGPTFQLVQGVLQDFQPRAVIVPINRELGAEDLVAPLRLPLMGDAGPNGASSLAFERLAHRYGYTLHPCPECIDHGLLLRNDVRWRSDEPWGEISLPHAATGHDDGPEAVRLAGYLTSENYLLDGVGVALTRYGRIAYFANDRFIGQVFATGGYWEDEQVSEITAVLRGKSGLVLDVGAHIGSHSVCLAACNPQLSFCCFEPQRPLFLLLERNIYENGLDGRIEAVWAAVGHRSGAFSMSGALEEDGLVHTVSHGAGELVNLGGIQLGPDGTPCRLVRLDDLQLPAVCYVKLDVEGSETLAIDGMSEMLRLYKPHVFFEDRADRRLPAATLDALCIDAALRDLTPTAQLESLGYSIEKLGDDFLALPAPDRIAAAPNTMIPAAIRHSTARVPRILHYVFGMAADFGGKPWSLVHHACLASAIVKIRPDEVFFHFEHEPSGPWWELSRPLVTLKPMRAPTEIFGNPLLHVAHRADVTRLQILLEQGGIYLDADVVVHRAFDDLLQYSTVMGIEGKGAVQGMANAVIVAERGSPFLAKWLDSYRSFRSRGRDEYWAEHGVQMPGMIALQQPNLINVLPYDAFFWPLWTPEHLHWIYETTQPVPGAPYVNHLWESMAWPHLENLTPGRVRRKASNFHQWMSPYVRELPDDYGQISTAPELLVPAGVMA